MSIGAWGEGDPLTPTNLNNRGGGPLSATSLVNVSWSMFSSSHNTTSIQSAINYAKTNNYAGIVIPQSYLPYDTSTISDIYTVRRFREGGSQIFGEIDAVAYGGGPSESAYAGTQAAITAACNGAGFRVLLPPSTNRYLLSKPLLITNRIEVCGYAPPTTAGFGIPVTSLQAGYAYGPTVVIASSADSVPTAASLLNGAGSSLSFPDSSRWFNLRDAYSLELDGLSQFCVEATVKATSLGAGHNYVCASSGKLLDGDAITAAFALDMNGTLGAGFILNVGGTTKTIYGSAVSAGVQYHVAGTYDGSTIRVFLDGQLSASTTVSGTISQGVFEDVTIGPSFQKSPDRQIGDNGLFGLMDSIRISDTARYTTNFTPPTSKFVSDSNTLCLMNGDDFVGPCAKMYTKDGVFWAYMRDGNSGGGHGGGTYIHDLHIAPAGGRACGLFVGRYCLDLLFERITFSSTRIGLAFFTGDVYEWSANRLRFMNGAAGNRAGRFAIQSTGNSGLATLTRVDIWGGYAVPLLLYGLNEVHGAFIESTTNMVFGYVLGAPNIGDDFVMDSVNVSTEAGIGSDYRASSALDGASIIANGGALETATGKPFVIASSIHNSAYRGTTFHTPNHSIFSIIGTAPTTPILVTNCRQRSTWQPWSDTTGTVTVGRIGPSYSTSTGGTLLFDASVADEWDLTLTSDVTQSSWTRISYGQPVSGAIKMDSTGSRLFVWPTNSKGTVTLSYGSAAVNTFSGFYDGVNVILTSVRTGL